MNHHSSIPRRVLAVFGTRPEAIKMAPLLRALADQPDFAPLVAVTAQHRKMLDQVLQLFGITPDVDLDIGRERQTLSGITQRALAGLDQVLAELQPDVVMVQGDTTTALSGALAAFYRRVPVVHVEAGLRTGDIFSPYPEEMNRRLITGLSALHLAATPQAARNLFAENVDPAAVVCTGNSVIDALWATLAAPTYPPSTLVESLVRHPGPVLLVTAHRRESWGAPMAGIARALHRLAVQEPTLRIVLPAHLNPTVREALLPDLIGLPGVTITDPLMYQEFCRVMGRSDLILTDSGGVQEEGPSLGKPVLVLRETTERPEAIAAGTARLIGTDEHRIVAAVTELLHDQRAYEAMAHAVNPYGDGHCAGRTVAALRHFFGRGPRPVDFDPAAERELVSTGV